MTGRVWLFGNSVDTDAMYPAYAMKLDLPEAARHVFYQLRPDWTTLVQPGDIVVAGRNFGVGSSRPVASLFRHLGVAALIAEDFNSLFFRNAINAGLPALTVPDATTLFTDGDTATFDLATGTYRNETTGTSGRTAPLPDLILEILTSGGILARLATQGFLPPEMRDLLSSGVPVDTGSSA
ncbi:3-isopropylmalate dehydratase [Nocardia sp. NPDC088792]|uniref:LeuD/DmdB family oxidoreductase small subunit n=1 Tax=Nocardia sp. NPDC088792 TaxID=3364332 RepID=UPI00382A6F76